MIVSRPLLVTLIIMLAFVSVSAQSVTVRARKVVYNRTAKNVPDFKRTFEVRYPVFSGTLKPAVLQKLRSGTDYWKIFEMKSRRNSAGRSLAFEPGLWCCIQQEQPS